MRLLAIVVLLALIATSAPLAAAADSPVECFPTFDAGERGTWDLNTTATRFVSGTGPFALNDLRCSYVSPTGEKSVAFHVLWSEGTALRTDGPCSLSPEARASTPSGPYPQVASLTKNARVSGAPERGWKTTAEFDVTEQARAQARALLSLVDDRASTCDEPAACTPSISIRDADLYFASYSGALSSTNGRGFLACYYRDDLSNASSLSMAFRIEWFTEAQPVSPAWCFQSATTAGFVTIPGKQIQVAWVTDTRIGQNETAQADARGVAEDFLFLVTENVADCGDESTAPTVASPGTPTGSGGVQCPDEVDLPDGAVAKLKLASRLPSTGPTPRGGLLCEFAPTTGAPLNFTIEWRPSGAATSFYLGCRHEIPDRTTAYSTRYQSEARWTTTEGYLPSALFDSAMKTMVDVPEEAAMACPEASGPALLDAPCPSSVPMGDAQLALSDGQPLGRDDSTRWREARCAYGEGDAAVTFVVTFAADTGAKQAWPCSKGPSENRFVGAEGRALGVEVQGNSGGSRQDDVKLVALAFGHWYSSQAIKCIAIPATLPGPGAFFAIGALVVATILIRSKR